MGYQAWFQCQKGCDERYSLYEVVYRCKKCGSLLKRSTIWRRCETARRNSGRTFRHALHADELSPYGSAILGQDGVGLPDNRARKRHLHV